jgi:hypothetical protein
MPTMIQLVLVCVVMDGWVIVLVVVVDRWIGRQSSKWRQKFAKG